MSNVWHITNQDENTTDVPEKENFVVLIGHWTSCLWYGGEEPEPIFWENVKKWCYLDELILENERTRKENEDKQAVLNCVVDMLKTLNQRYTLIMGKDVIKETVRLLEKRKNNNE